MGYFGEYVWITRKSLPNKIVVENKKLIMKKYYHHTKNNYPPFKEFLKVIIVSDSWFK